MRKESSVEERDSGSKTKKVIAGLLIIFGNILKKARKALLKKDSTSPTLKGLAKKYSTTTNPPKTKYSKVKYFS